MGIHSRIARFVLAQDLLDLALGRCTIERIGKAAVGEPQLFEWLCKKKNGELFWVEVNLKGGVMYGKEVVPAVVRDISKPIVRDELRKAVADVASHVSANIDGALPDPAVKWVIPDQLARSHGPKVRTPETVEADVDRWIQDVKERNIKSILCLVDQEELDRFYGTLSGGLLNCYADRGFEVEHIPAQDLSLPPLDDSQLRRVWHSFQRLPKPVLIHCRHGIARTGHAVHYIKQKLLA